MGEPWKLETDEPVELESRTAISPFRLRIWRGNAMQPLALASQHQHGPSILSHVLPIADLVNQAYMGHCIKSFMLLAATNDPHGDLIFAVDVDWWGKFDRRYAIKAATRQVSWEVVEILIGREIEHNQIKRSRDRKGG